MCVCMVFFFKQKTAYEMRISDWSSDVCSSDLTDAAQGVAQGMLTLLDADAAGSTRLVLVGNSYGALLAYETAWRLLRAAVSIDRPIVSRFRTPILPLADTPLYRLPLVHLRSGLPPHFGCTRPAQHLIGEHGWR